MKRGFTALDPREALHAAICIEHRNAGIYQDFARMFVEFGDPESLEIASVFWEMAVEERRHETLLQTAYADSYDNQPCGLTDEDLLELIEVPRLETGNFFSGEQRQPGEARNRALRVALAAEAGARRYYGSIAAQTPEGPQRRLYLELSAMEEGHEAYLERQLIPEDTAQPVVN